ncbi:uncharacterized protein LOC125823236 [Solanum verrucosum]|uniref:uncharacterized protein LOC125823236 n=1 Tax=Solanum verrucosum TaxID=315347 RepID=UPI0020D0DE59|nr:uncharacterized protein LOC125823236 [Solanum verrucosum]
MVSDDEDKGLSVVTRSEKEVKADVMGNEEEHTRNEGKDIEEEEITIPQDVTKESQSEEEKHKPCLKAKKRMQDEKFKKFLSVFNTLSINLPLVEALLEMPGYAKFMNELVTKKRSLDFETIKVSHSCSTIVTKKLIEKKNDPGAFTIPCTISMLMFAKSLCDLGATTMRLLMADRSIKHPVGILYDILVKVDRFIFPADFVILDCDIDAKIPIILGRPFLATGRVLVDVESGELKIRVNEDEVTFDMYKSMKHPSDIHVISTDDMVDEAVASVSHLMCSKEPLEVVLANDE